MNNFEKKKKFTITFDWKFYLMMGVTIVVWALAFPYIKIGLRELSFVNLTIMRFFIVSIAFLIIYIIRKNKISKLHKKDIIPIFFLGVFGVIAYHLGLNYGEQFISAGAASLIIATIPIQIVILSIMFLKEKITMKKILGIVISFLGVIIISLWGSVNTTLEINYLFGALAVLFAAAMGAIYTIVGKKYLERYTGFSLTIYAMFLGSIGLIPFVRESLIYEVSNMSFDGWLSIIILGVFSTVIGYSLWYIALEKKNASDLGVYLYAIPVLSTIISFQMFKDQITYLYILGGFLVILGLIIVNFEKRNKAKLNEKID
jgi:drug/metabolite transporter (DMT)-like permease